MCIRDSVCGARNLGEALRRIAEGAAMIRTKGEAGSGNIVEAVRHMRTIVSEMRRLTTLREDELVHASKELGAPLELCLLYTSDLRQNVPLRVEQEAYGAFPGRQAFHVAGEQRVQIARAVRSLEAKNSVVICVRQDGGFTRGAVFGFQRTKSRRQRATEICSERRALRAMHFEQSAL